MALEAQNPGLLSNLLNQMVYAICFQTLEPYVSCDAECVSAQSLKDFGDTLGHVNVHIRNICKCGNHGLCIGPVIFIEVIIFLALNLTGVTRN